MLIRSRKIGVSTVGFGPMVGIMVIASVARAEAPVDSECGAAGKAAAELRSTGKLTAARARLAACLSDRCSSQVQDECAIQQAAIDAAMPAVVLEAKDEASNNISAVRVTMDGTTLIDGLDGKPILVDPGEHHLALEAAGFHTTEATFVAREQEKNLRVVVFLNSARSLAPDRLTFSAVTSAAGRQAETTGFARYGGNVGLVLGCAGIAGVVVGTVWSIMSKVTYDHALTTDCAGDANRCSSRGLAEGETAHRQAGIATVGFAAGGALIAAGTILYLWGPNETGVAIAPSVGLDGGGSLAVVSKW